MRASFLMNNRNLLFSKELKSCFRKSINPSEENLLYSPRFQGAKAQLRQSRTRALKMNLRFFKTLIPLRRFGGGMGVQRDVGGNPSIPPSSVWAQRSAQPVGINKRVLLKCIRIVIVAYRLRSDSRIFSLRDWVTMGISSPYP